MFFLPGFEPLLIHTNVSQTSVSENVCFRAQAFKLFNQTALFLYNQQPKYPHFAYLYFLFKCSSLKSAQLVWLVFDVSWSAIKSEILRVACTQKKKCVSWVSEWVPISSFSWSYFRDLFSEPSSNKLYLFYLISQQHPMKLIFGRIMAVGATRCYLGLDLLGLVATVICGVWVTWAP